MKIKRPRAPRRPRPPRAPRKIGKHPALAAPYGGTAREWTHQQIAARLHDAGVELGTRVHQLIETAAAGPAKVEKPKGDKQWYVRVGGLDQARFNSKGEAEIWADGYNAAIGYSEPGVKLMQTHSPAFLGGVIPKPRITPYSVKPTREQLAEAREWNKWAGERIPCGPAAGSLMHGTIIHTSDLDLAMALVLRRIREGGQPI